jgi:hypothetical protein
MAATKSQGRAFALFIGGITAATAGVAYLATGTGKASLFLGLAALLAAFFAFIRLKPEEGKVPKAVEPLVLKALGVLFAVGGWLIVLYGIHLTSSVSGRFATTLVGLAVTLVGVLYFLPTAASKNAIWKG